MKAVRKLKEANKLEYSALCKLGERIAICQLKFGVAYLEICVSHLVTMVCSMAFQQKKKKLWGFILVYISCFSGLMFDLFRNGNSRVVSFLK